MGDCYSAYTGIHLRSADGIIHAACNTHARRKIFEARANHPQVASVLLAMYQELYDIEDRARGLDVLSRLNLRQQESAAVWLRMREYLDSDLVKKLVPKEAIRQAISYINNHWTALQVYVSNALVPIDNNLTEQLMKQVAIGRKNWLFIGSLAAGGRTADLMTLVSSAIRNDLHVWPTFSNPHQGSARRPAGRLNGLPFPPPRHLGRQPSRPHPHLPQGRASRPRRPQTTRS